MEALRYVVQANLILAVLVLAYTLLLRQTTRFTLNRVVLWVIAFEAVCLPFARLPTVQPEPVRAMVNRTTEVFREPLRAITPPNPKVFFTLPDGKTYPATFNTTAARFPNWPTLLLWLYSTVALSLLVRLGWRIIRLRVLIEGGIWTHYTDFVLVQASVESPFSFGQFVVLNSSEYSGRELDQILRHERMHVREQHIFDVLLAEGLTILFWFNPVAYLFRRLVNQNLEYLADRGVLAEGIDARAYQFSLLRVSMGASGPILGNSFGQSGIADRIRMMLRPRSGVWGWLRYWLLAGVLAVVVLVLAVREQNDFSDPDKKASFHYIGDNKQIESLSHTPTFDLVREFSISDGWIIELAFLPTTPKVEWGFFGDTPVGLINNHLTLLEKHRFETELYIDGELADLEAFSQIQAENMEALFVVHQHEEHVKDPDPKPWRVLVQTSRTVVMPNQYTQQFLTYLQAAAISEHPTGHNHTFSMNEVLEATFFHRKDVMVERSQNEHLKLYEEFIPTTAVYINGVPASHKEVESVHIREVDKIYTIEVSYQLWFRAKNPTKRFLINIETSPKRAKRDSSYYVFSPFYSGDF